MPDLSVGAGQEHGLAPAPPTGVDDADGDGVGPPPGRRPHGPVISPFRVVVAAVVIAAGVVAWQLTRPVGASYRTATVGTGTAVAALSSVGTITPVNQANLNFAVAGTVSTVGVAVGQQVTAGEVVASLDPVPLQNTVIADQASVASAEATLATDEASQAASSTPTATLASVVTSGTAGSGPPTGGGSTGSGNATVAQLQAKLIADQKREDADSAAATAALTEATSICTAPAGATSSSSSSTPSTPAGGPAPPPSPGGAPTCSQALSAAATAQATLAGDIKTVAADEAALTSALEAANSATGSGGSASTGSGASGGATSSSGGGGASGGASTGAAASSGGSGNPKAKVVTAEKLALDQADIDVAQAGLDNAQRALASANLVSTISGTVGAVTLAVGSSVSAGSSTTTGQLVIIGTGSSYQVMTTVPVAKIGQVAVGQQALVTPDSSGTAIPGTVTGIGVLATTGSTSTTYPVTVNLESSSLGLFSGGEAGVSIVTSRVAGVTTVPTSAVRTVGTTHLVTVVDGSTTKSVRVTIGTVGAVLTQIKSGVSPGQQVSIADLAQPVPPSSTTSTRFGLAGLGGAGGLAGRAGGIGGAGGGFRGGIAGG